MSPKRCLPPLWYQIDKRFIFRLKLTKIIKKKIKMYQMITERVHRRTEGKRGAAQNFTDYIKVSADKNDIDIMVLIDVFKNLCPTKKNISASRFQILSILCNSSRESLILPEFLRLFICRPPPLAPSYAYHCVFVNKQCSVFTYLPFKAN